MGDPRATCPVRREVKGNPLDPAPSQVAGRRRLTWRPHRGPGRPRLPGSTKHGYRESLEFAHFHVGAIGSMVPGSFLPGITMDSYPRYSR
jgi:hypothetical protein